MATHPKTAKARTPTETSEPRREPVAPAPKRKGRPPGSKNAPRQEPVADGAAPKVKAPPLPPELATYIACMPLEVAGELIEYGTRPAPGRPGVRVVYSPEAQQACARAFLAWSDTWDWELSPGMGYLVALLTAVASVMPVAMAQALELQEKERERRATEQKAKGKKPEPAAEPIDPNSPAASAPPANAAAPATSAAAAEIVHFHKGGA